MFNKMFTTLFICDFLKILDIQKFIFFLLIKEYDPFIDRPQKLWALFIILF